jgi:hypothetical protein
VGSLARVARSGIVDLQVTALDPPGTAQPSAQRVETGALAADGAEHTDVRNLFRSLRVSIQRGGQEAGDDYAKQGVQARHAITDHLNLKGYWEFAAQNRAEGWESLVKLGAAIVNG